MIIDRRKHPSKHDASSIRGFIQRLELCGLRQNLISQSAGRPGANSDGKSPMSIGRGGSGNSPAAAGLSSGPAGEASTELRRTTGRSEALPSVNWGDIY